jgi:branched-chain amino acid transport system permease protein
VLAIGWLLGYPARVQHHYLAFVTLAFTTLVFLVLRNEEWLTNGIYGITGTERPVFWAGRPAAHSTSTSSARHARRLGGGNLVMLRSPWGRAFLALRENRYAPCRLARPPLPL